MAETKEQTWQIERSKLTWMLVVIALLVIADQWSKVWAANHLMGSETRYYFFDTVQLRYAENAGAWGGLGSDWPPTARLWALVILPTVFLIGLGIYVACRREFRLPESLAFATILGGGIGNLIDRIAYGYVVDFLYMGIGRVGTNIFNIADVAIMTGTAFVIFFSIRTARQLKEEPDL